MSERWTPEEDTRIEKQLKRGIVISKVKVAGRKTPDIRKRAIRVGLIKKAPTFDDRRATQWMAIEASLTAGDKTLGQLVSETGMTLDVVRKVIKAYREQVHVSGRDRATGGSAAKIWALGAREDAPDYDENDPVAVALFETQGDPEAAMIAEARERLRQAEARGELIRQDPFVTALFGQYQPLTFSRLAQ